MAFEPVLTNYVREPNSFTLDFYLKNARGYEGLRKALTLKPGEIIDQVKASGLRGRGGAGFPTGLKWQFVLKDTPKPKYIACNADESEPGTFKDHVLMERNPHLLIEGCAIGCYAIGAKVAYIYIRGEFYHVQETLERAIEEAYRAGFLGKNILGSGYDLDVLVYRGAGAYICGEETALLESLEGKRGLPRIKPPFPAIVGLYGCPTIINNVETLANVPFIVERGAAWFAGIGRPKNTGPKLFCLSGHVKKPGVFEAPLGIPFLELLNEHAGGMLHPDRPLKAAVPGGSSMKILPANRCEVLLDFDSLAAAGTMLGSAGGMVMDSGTCMVGALLNLAEFYEHESCGQCTPCREGTGWFTKILHRLETGHGRKEDPDLLIDVARRVEGNTICPFGEAIAWPVQSYVAEFKSEFDDHVTKGACPFGGAAVKR